MQNNSGWKRLSSHLVGTYRDCPHVFGTYELLMEVDSELHAFGGARLFDVHVCEVPKFPILQKLLLKQIPLWNIDENIIKEFCGDLGQNGEFWRSEMGLKH